MELMREQLEEDFKKSPKISSIFQYFYQKKKFYIMVLNRKLTNILHGQYKAHKKKKKILIQPITSMMKLSTHTTKTNITHLGKASVFFFFFEGMNKLIINSNKKNMKFRYGSHSRGRRSREWRQVQWLPTHRGSWTPNHQQYSSSSMKMLIASMASPPSSISMTTSSLSFWVVIYADPTEA